MEEVFAVRGEGCLLGVKTRKATKEVLPDRREV